MASFIKVRETFFPPIWRKCVVSQTVDNFEIDNFEIHKWICGIEFRRYYPLQHPSSALLKLQLQKYLGIAFIPKLFL
jgi:hypothetical protein